MWKRFIKFTGKPFLRKVFSRQGSLLLLLLGIFILTSYLFINEQNKFRVFRRKIPGTNTYDVIIGVLDGLQTHQFTIFHPYDLNQFYFVDDQIEIKFLHSPDPKQKFIAVFSHDVNLNKEMSILKYQNGKFSLIQKDGLVGYKEDFFRGNYVAVSDSLINQTNVIHEGFLDTSQNLPLDDFRNYYKYDPKAGIYKIFKITLNDKDFMTWENW